MPGEMPQAGDPAPDFTLSDQDGSEVSLSGLRGRPVVLYFYPRDDTPGCTTQACGIRDRWPEYVDRGAVVLGVSADDVESHARFRAKHDLPHTLLADPAHEVCDAYGTWVEKSMYGRRFWGIQRATFVIDPEGTIAHAIPKASPKAHDDLVLEALDELSGAAA